MRYREQQGAWELGLPFSIFLAAPGAGFWCRRANMSSPRADAEREDCSEIALPLTVSFRSRGEARTSVWSLYVAKADLALVSHTTNFHFRLGNGGPNRQGVRMSKPPPGWYPVPPALTEIREWDGAKWFGPSQPFEAESPSLLPPLKILPAGWLPNPANPDQEIYWDGDGWTGVVRPRLERTPLPRFRSV